MWMRIETVVRITVTYLCLHFFSFFLFCDLHEWSLSQIFEYSHFPRLAQKKKKKSRLKGFLYSFVLQLWYCGESRTACANMLTWRKQCHVNWPKGIQVPAPLEWCCLKPLPPNPVAPTPPFSLLSLLITIASPESPLLLHLSPQPLTEML